MTHAAPGQGCAVSAAPAPSPLSARRGWVHRGWSHVHEDESDADRHGTTHFAERAGERRALHWSPFRPYSERHFRRAVDLGFPTAATGTILPEEIDRIWAARSPAA
ncbi:hypothetical protein [Sphingomonas colocasiae]|uniref:Uncharacterized protein n=1 Tax=Sphingomonas colocasiae TaxID=1848973 RepID=A0ABS7PPG7_9SPHN|nr:hypothetical protein [Sphingomonas colocasiae]MBY8821924.1 hypothetical protein [Sphingomonas colocasiae]